MSKTIQTTRSPLALAREKNGWTQEYVAQQINVSIDTVRQWERRRHLPYQATIQELCKLFEMTPQELGLLKEQNTSSSSEETKMLVDSRKEASNFTSVATVIRVTNAVQLLPDGVEKQAAWEIYVELVTRIPVASLGHSEGILREALSSLYSLFHVTRTILRNYGPAIARCQRSNDPSFGYLAVCMLNTTLRPFLAKWHPLLKAYEEIRPASMGITEHEQQWKQSLEFRQEINKLSNYLVKYAQIFAQIAEVPSLLVEDA